MARKNNDRAESAEPKKAAKVECAVRFDSVYGKHGEIIELDAAAAEAAYAAGYVDTHPNAIRAIREAEKG